MERKGVRSSIAKMRVPLTITLEYVVFDEQIKYILVMWSKIERYERKKEKSLMFST